MGRRIGDVSTTATYVRLSQNRGHDEDKPDRQRIQIAPLLGTTPYEEYLDDDRSAYRGKARPAWTRLLDDIEAGHVNRIVAAHIDRVLRSTKELVGLIDLAEARPFVIETAASGTLDLSNSAGRMQARLLVTFAENESERKAERHQAKAAQLRSQGRSTGGPRPFGWKTPEGPLEPAEEELIRSGIRTLIEGGSLYAIRSSWNASGITSAMGNTFKTNLDVARILTRWRNAGLVEHAGEPVGPACWPAIVTEDEVRAVRQILSDPSRKTTPGPTRKHLLSGLATCAKCGHTLRKARAGRGEAYYACSGPRCYLSIQVAAAERYIISQTVVLFSRTDPADFAPAQEDRERLVSLRSERAQIDATLAEIADSVGSGAWTMQMAQRASQGLLERREEIDRTLGVIATRIATAVMLSDPVATGEFVPFERVAAIRSNFTSLDLHRKRAIIREVFTAITVHPGRGSAEDRIEIVKRPRN